MLGDGDGGAAGEGFECRCVVVLSAAVAALLAFTQQNVTGPPRKFPTFPFWISSLDERCYSNLGDIWDAWASDNLASFGSHVHGKFSLLQFIVFAKLLFTSLQSLDLSDCCSVPWWLFRISMFQQNILDDLSSSLFDQVQVYKNKMLDHFGELEKVSTYWDYLLSDGEGSYFVSAAFLEAGIVEYKYGRVDASRLHLNSAQEACGLHLSLTGILGFRTIHQVDAKSQMVLVAKTNKSGSDEGQVTEPTVAQNDNAALKNARSFDSVEGDEFCDILRMPRLVHDGSNSASEDTTNHSAKISLSAIQQAAVLAQCLHVSRRSRSDEMSGWEMAPYIESIDSQEESYFVIRSLCDILRVRWESTRSRTKQRALLMMENLVEDIGKEFPAAPQRVKMVFAVHMPTLPTLRKEYGELLISCGIVGEALDIFKDLELWDNLIYCYRLLGKVADAVSLINARLSVTPNDPRLWCSLGDVTNNDDHYKKALEVSNSKSARAMRSLARSAYNRNDFHTSKILWESALSLNSLIPDGWFAYGTAAWKDKDLDKAVDAFSRAVQIDPENGEAWNNIACLHMIRGKSQAAVQAFREAVKFKRNSWEIWENYSKVALDTGNIRLTLEALKTVLNLSSNKCFNVGILDKVMTMLEEPSPNFVDTHEALDDTNKETRQSNQLFDIIGDILQQIVRSGGSNADVWGLYARWHKTKGNLMACSEALLKQVRSLQGSGLWHDQMKFAKYAQTSLKLCKAYMEISSSTGSRRELFTAEMHPRFPTAHSPSPLRPGDPTPGAAEASLTDMWALNNAKAGGPCLTPRHPAPLSLASPSTAAAGRTFWRRTPVWAPLVAVRASGGTRKDGPGGGEASSGEEADSKASSSGHDDASTPTGDTSAGLNQPHAEPNTSKPINVSSSNYWRDVRANLVRREQELLVDPSTPTESKASSGDPLQLPQKWAHAIPMPEAGCVLVATEALDDDSIFERTVIFILRLGSRGTFDGPFGVILNRPLYTKIKHVNPTFQDQATPFGDSPLFFGGPVDMSMFLVRTDDSSRLKGFEEVVPGICYGFRTDLEKAAVLMKSGAIRTQDVRFYVGHAAWDYEQLLGEIRAGYWAVASCSTELISDALTGDPSCLWTEILQLMGGQYSELSEKPKQDSS